jgi:hypothetical protein
VAEIKLKLVEINDGKKPAQKKPVNWFWEVR